MTKSSLNGVLLRRLSAVAFVAESESKRPTAGELAAAVGNAYRLGFALNEGALAAAASSSVEQLEALLQELRELRGAHSYQPMYPNFPKQVAEASELELYLNAVVHYVGASFGLCVLPAYTVEARRGLPPGDYRVEVLRAATLQEAQELARKLVTQGQPHSEQDREDLLALAPLVEAAPVAVRENLAWLAASFPKLDWSESFKTVTDVLRLAVALCGGDTSLAEPTRFKLSRAQRRQVLALLERVLEANGENFEDFARHSEKWKRLARALHPGDHPHPLAARGLREVTEGRVKTFDSAVEAALTSGSLEEVLALLKFRPGVFARRLLEVVRKFPQGEEVVASEFARVGGSVSTPVLVQLWNHLTGPQASEVATRVVQVKSSAKKTRFLPNRLEKTHPSLLAAVESSLGEKLRGKTVRLQGSAAEWATLPLGLRSSSSGLRALGRGSRVPLEGEKDTVRLFMSWRDMEGDAYESRVDLDLSAYFASSDLKKFATVSYYNLREVGAYHSGDITAAPQGAAEYIDVHIPTALAAGWRYVVMTVLNFTGQTLAKVPEARAGFMLRSKPQDGEIFEAASVESAYSLTTEGLNSTPLVFDLQERTALWWDSALMPNTSLNYNVASNETAFQVLLRHLVASHPMTVAKFLRLSGATLVADPEAPVDFEVDALSSEEVLQLLEL